MDRNLPGCGAKPNGGVNRRRRVTPCYFRLSYNRDVLTRSATTGLWRDTSETALFVSDVGLPAAQCAKAIRDHWHIENRSHYVRDGSFAEDASRIRRNPGIFARLRSFAANILRFNGIHNVSNGRHRIAFGGINAILGMRIMY